MKSGAVSPQDYVPTGAAADGIIKIQTLDHIVTVQTKDHVCPGGTDQQVVPVGPVDRRREPVALGGRRQVVQGSEHVCIGVGVPVHEVGGGGLEDDVPAVGADTGLAAIRTALLAVVGQRHPGRPARLQVVHQHVAQAVGVSNHQVGGIGAESDEPAVGANAGPLTLAVAAVPGRGDGDPPGKA